MKTVISVKRFQLLTQFFLGAINRGDKIEKNRRKKKISENPEKPRKPLKTKG